MALPPIDEIRLRFNPTAVAGLNVVMAFLMFGIALDVQVAEFRRLLQMPVAFAVGIVAQFVALPLFTFGLTLVLGVGPSVALGMILVACCPPGSVSNLITHRARGNVALSVSMTAVSNAIAIVVMPLNFLLWGGIHPTAAGLLRTIALDPAQVVVQIVAIIGLPFGLGLWCAHRFPGWVNGARKPVGLLGLAVLILFVVGATAANWRLFVDYVGVVIVAVVLHDGLAFGTGWGFARIFGLADYDRRAMTIEVGMRNAGLGFGLVFTFFGGLGGMAMVAGVWGIVDIAAGLLLAAWWARQPCVPAAAIAPRR